jgi:hypothetical protein
MPLTFCRTGSCIWMMDATKNTVDPARPCVLPETNRLLSHQRKCCPADDQRALADRIGNLPV